MIQGLITAFLLLVFLGGCVWAFSRKQQAGFDAAARLALDPEQADRPSPDRR